MRPQETASLSTSPICFVQLLSSTLRSFQIWVDPSLLPRFSRFYCLRRDALSLGSASTSVGPFVCILLAYEFHLSLFLLCLDFSASAIALSHDPYTSSSFD